MVAVKAQTGEQIINGRYVVRGSLGMGGVGLVTVRMTGSPAPKSP